MRSPGLALALLFTIALGLGSNVAVLGFIRGLVVRNSPIPANSKVVSLFGLNRYRGTEPVSYEDYLLLKKHRDLFEWIGAARVSQSVIKLAGQSAIVSVAAVTPELADLFTLPLKEGVVMSRRVRQAEFRDEADIRGKEVHIGDVDARVGEVAPDGLDGIYGDRAIDLWMPLNEESLQGRDRTTRNLWVLAGLRHHVSADQVKNAIGATQVGGSTINILPYTGMTPEMAEGFSRVGTMLRVATGFVFFIACVNVASFLLGRATFRWHANSIRVALGVSRGRLAQAIVSDSVVISSAGGALSILLAVWTSKVIPVLLFEQDAEFLALTSEFFSIVLASAAGVGIIIACGLLPLLEIRHDRPAAVLGSEGAGPSKASRTVRASLIIAQMACCCLLVICTGFLYGGFRAALQTSASHRLGKPILATVQVHPDLDVDLKYFQHVEQAARSLPGVSGTAWSARLPGRRPVWQSFRVEPQGMPFREVKMDTAGFTSHSVAQFSWPPKAGRVFGFRDQGCRTAIVNEEAAEILFGSDTVGYSIRDSAGVPVEIIGVVAGRRGRQSRPTIYYNYMNRAVPPSDQIALARFSAPVASRLERAELDTDVVSPGYFAAMGFTVVAGRIFPADPIARGCRVAVVNQEAADLYFAANAVGSAIIDDLGQRTEIIGVVHSVQLGSFQRRAEPTVYFPMAQDCLPSMTLAIGTPVADSAMLAKVHQTLESVPGRGPAPLVVKTLETHLSQTALAPLHIATALVGACAATALLLSVLGLYGALSDGARARRRDLAIRIALGARRRDVIHQVLREGGRLAGAGSIAGVLGSLALSGLLPRAASGIGAPNLWVWIAGPIVLTVAVAVAGVLPARRALMLDPLRILRGN